MNNPTTHPVFILKCFNSFIILIHHILFPLNDANNVSWVHTGLQARIKELSLSALYTHCYAHVLNLVIVDTMTNNTVAKDLFGTLQNLYVFIELLPESTCCVFEIPERVEYCRRGSEEAGICPEEVVRYQMGVSGGQRHSNLQYIRSGNRNTKGGQGEGKQVRSYYGTRNWSRLHVVKVKLKVRNCELANNRINE